MNKRQYLFIFGVIMLLSLTAANAQTAEKPRILEGHNCEDGSSWANTLWHEAREKNERIFVISRVGDGETETMNTRRINAVKNQLDEKNDWSRLEPKVIYAKGEKVKGKGQVEFYVGGKLVLVMKVQKRGGYPCLYCCEDPFERKSKRKLKNGN